MTNHEKQIRLGEYQVTHPKLNPSFKRLVDPPKPLNFHLGMNELELLQLIASGLTTKEIAGNLRTTEHNTETQRIRLLKKCGVKNSAELVAFGFRNGILK